MRTYSDIEQMAAQDYSIGLTAHYKPLAELIEQRSYKDIVEIGTAYGGNAFYMVNNTSIDCLVCVDPYLYYPAMPGFICQKECDTLAEFADNRLSEVCEKNGVMFQLLKANSKEALQYIDFCDLVFMDGSHDYEDVKWELENYCNVIRKGGVLSGHDYNIFEGVNKAVDEFAGKSGKPVKQLDGNIWYMEF